MKRRLFIIRHGKSSWDHEGLRDIERPLAPRGLKAADAMARRLLKRGTIPSLVYSSPAKRALTTAKIMCEVWGLDPDRLEVHEDIYEAWVDDLERVLARAPAEEDSLAIFGHNPTFTSFANHFLAAPLDNLPTAGVVLVDLESDDWSGLDAARVLGTYVDFPKKGT